MVHWSFLSSHTIHEGGSDPNEKNHITASFRDKDNQKIPNGFNGGVCIIFLHHAQLDKPLTTICAMPDQTPRICWQPWRYYAPGKSSFEHEQRSDTWPASIPSAVSQQNSDSWEEQQQRKRHATCWNGIFEESQCASDTLSILVVQIIVHTRTRLFE